MTQTKQCTKCKETKELTEFYQNKSSKDGFITRCKACIRVYQKNNRDKINAAKRKKRAECPEARITHATRNRMRKFINGEKKSASTLELLGCTREHFRLHLEQQFTDGMTWDNYGDWHMDHIQPCASFDQADPEQQKQCWHYTNYQPLWAEDNIRKSDTIINEHQTKLL
jgi:hypothetical protein